MLHRLGHSSAVQCSRTRPMIINVCGVIDDALIMKFFVFCSAGISFGMLLLLTPTWWNWWMVPSITRQLPSRRAAASSPRRRAAAAVIPTTLWARITDFVQKSLFVFALQMTMKVNEKVRSECSRQWASSRKSSTLCNEQQNEIAMSWVYCMGNCHLDAELLPCRWEGLTKLPSSRPHRVQIIGFFKFVFGYFSICFDSDDERHNWKVLIMLK